MAIRGRRCKWKGRGDDDDTVPNDMDEQLEGMDDDRLRVEFSLKF